MLSYIGVQCLYSSLLNAFRRSSVTDETKKPRWFPLPQEYRSGAILLTSPMSELPRLLRWTLTLTALRADLRTRVDALRSWAVDVVCWDPRLVIRFGTRRDSWSICTRDSDLLARVDLLCAQRRSLSSLSAFSAGLLLGEKGGDPGAVDEVAGAYEGTGEDKVEEDAGRMSVLGLRENRSQLTSAGRRYS